MADQFNTMLDSFRIFWNQFSLYLPKVVLSLVLSFVGWLVAKLLRRTTVKALKLIKLDEMAEKSGIEDFLVQGGVRFTTVTLLANLVYWFIMITLLLAVLNSLGLEVAAALLNKIVLYIPNVVVAIIVLIFGTLFARIVQGIAYAYLNNIGISGAQVMSLIAQYAILFFVVSVALEQLSIGGQVLISAFQIAFGALCLALALAFGLGGKEWAAQILEKTWKQ